MKTARLITRNIPSARLFQKSASRKFLKSQAQLHTASATRFQQTQVANHELANHHGTDEETKHFNKLASSWWDINGPQRILHKMNLVRMDFIQDTIKNNIPLNNQYTVPGDEIYVPGYNLDLLPPEISQQIVQDQKDKRQAEYAQLQYKALDIGCGGGILSESLARLPIVESVKGLDLAEEVIRVAKQHKALDPAINDKINYQLQAIETLPSLEMFNIITMFEILEHVDRPEEFLKTALAHLQKDGILFLSTINKDFVSWFTTIFMGEYVLRIVPVGTHHLSKYIDHSQLHDLFNSSGGSGNGLKNQETGEKLEGKFEVISSKGGSYLPFYGWYLHGCPDVGNYFMAIKRSA